MEIRILKYFLAIDLDKIINATGESNLCFRPLKPKLQLGMSIVWKNIKYFQRQAKNSLKS